MEIKVDVLNSVSTMKKVYPKIVTYESEGKWFAYSETKFKYHTTSAKTEIKAIVKLIGELNKI